jgi:hypothetical protein
MEIKVDGDLNFLSMCSEKSSLPNVPESCDALCGINRNVRETKLYYKLICLKTGATSRIPASEIEFPVRIASVLLADAVDTEF